MIAAGHSPAVVWNYTPRQIAGWSALAARRRRIEYADQLSIVSLASRGDPKELKKQHKALQRDG